MVNEELKNIELQIEELKKKKQTITGKEEFSIKKFMANGLGILNSVSWAKWFNSSIKTILIVAVGIGVIYGLGYWKGWKKQPALLNANNFSANVPCEYTDQIHNITLRDNHLYFDEKSVVIGQIIKLKPYGLQLIPKMFAGFSSTGPFVGAGVELAHFYKLNLDAFLATDKSINLGISYDLKSDKNDGKEHMFDNTSIGIAVGKRIDSIDETSIKVYGCIKF